MVQWGWTCSETWAEDEASSTVTCSLGQNFGSENDGVPGGLGVGVRTKSQVSPDGARREAALLELDTEGHMMLGQEGCSLGCPLLIAILNGLGQAPCQLFYKERVHHHSWAWLLAPPPLATCLYLSPSSLQNSDHPSWGP